MTRAGLPATATPWQASVATGATRRLAIAMMDAERCYTDTFSDYDTLRE
jgi:hypothetical protein